MTTLREAAQQALETCTDVVNGWESLAPLSVRRAAIESLDALRAALAEPERQWVGLTEEEIKDCFTITPDAHLPWHIYKRIEAKLKEKNT